MEFYKRNYCIMRNNNFNDNSFFSKTTYMKNTHMITQSTRRSPCRRIYNSSSDFIKIRGLWPISINSNKSARIQIKKNNYCFHWLSRYINKSYNMFYKYRSKSANCIFFCIPHITNFINLNKF